ncbi:hypothetical protein CMO90_03030 [Candidatus Woesearchaeota archaeon]|nr:hypothetical protein [Candidatus Woesearchaeota archaeon]
MRDIDKFALEINRNLRGRYKLLTEKTGPYLNIIGIFFHELMIYLSNYYIIKSSEYTYKEDVVFPYLNSKYCNAPFNVQFGQSEQLQSNYKSTVIIAIIYFRNIVNMLFKNRKSISIIHPDLFMATTLIKLPFSYKINLIKNKKVYLKNYECQVDFLRDTIDQICIKYDIPCKNIFVENFINYIKNNISDCELSSPGEYLLVESNTLITNRVNSANYLDSGKKVIGVSHGFGYSLQLDDPIMGYGEFSYCNQYLTFGATTLEFGEYNHSLNEAPKFHRRTSDLLESIYTANPIIKKSESETSKILYIPTGYSFNKRYGPFRDIDDQLYNEWQNAIIDHSNNIFYKAYPGQNKLVNIPDERLIQNDLKTKIHILNQFDLIIIDYFSTISNLVAATDKPIIYFNLGLMNIALEAKKDFKERVFWCDVDLSKDYSIQVQDGFNKYFRSEQSFINTYTKKYCLNNNNMSELDLIKDIIENNSFI